MYNSIFHRFTDKELAEVTLPSLFTYPFHYIPHPLCVKASEYVQFYLSTHHEWQVELRKGKMMGVLIVEKDHEIGFLAAFSGNLAHSNNHPYFVPAVYDLLSEKGFFRPEEDNISAINRQIADTINGEERKAIISKLVETEQSATKAIDDYKQFMKKAKAQRDELRKQGADNNSLIAESQFQKAELKRLQVHWQQQTNAIKTELETIDNQISQWKAERSKRSAALQELIFRHFKMLNARGEYRDLCDIFADTPQHTPPAGAGECAAPKLLQYAFLNDYRPIAMAEFWVGESPKDIIRRHGYFYPSCKAKCEPILNWMLQGLDVEPNPLKKQIEETPIDIVYEDEWILAVNKPAGMLSVPGKTPNKSLQELIEKRFSPQNKPLIIHRLDMATSGILLLAKTPFIYHIMQSIFKSRYIEKQYIAILDGYITQKEGTISLPLVLNPQERPLQMVSHTHGKEAITHFTVLEHNNNKTRIAFYPVTGRTHQLRVHSAHPEGLNTPIVGDTLYGKHADRLYLHAQSVTFTHPITGNILQISAPCPF